MAIRSMNDEPRVVPERATWKWLRVLTLVLWAGLAFSAMSLAGGLLVAEHFRGFYTVFMFLSGVSVLLMAVLLLAAPISILLHAVALFKQRIAARSAYLGMISGAVVAIADLVLMAYAGSRLG